MRIQSILILFILFYASSCKTARPVISDQGSYRFLDIEEAKKEILDDDTEFFFDKISLLEMEIQMRDNANLSKEERFADFQEYLRKEVMEWSAEEKKWMSQAMDSAILHVKKLNPKLLKEQILLIKVNTNHYGASVFYTREDVIVIPKNVLNAHNYEMLYSVMLHELSHIVSRNYPDLKKQMYSLIGFKPIGKELEYPLSVTDRILTNPDGINDDYAITLTEGDKETNAIPLIVSNYSSFKKEVPAFFNYIKFDLYELAGNNVIADKNGFSTLDKELMASFFEQIKDNTQYIIHPDEIIADNFMLLIKSRESDDYSQFSSDGKTLILNLNKILLDF